MKQRDGYDETHTIRVRGLEGVFAGSTRLIRLGETIFVGRGRECDLRPNSGTADSCKRMSRKHLRVSYCNPEHIELEDVSANGTFMNGKRIDRVVLEDIEAEPAVLDLLGGTVVVEGSENIHTF